MRTLTAFAAALLLVYASANGNAAQAAPATTTTATKPAPLRVLFIGDGYTSANGGVDQVLQALARARGRSIECAATTSSNKTLQWHWESGGARAAIAKGRWDYIVLQEHGTVPLTQPQQTLEFARRFDGEIRRVGAKTVLFFTWAAADQPKTHVSLESAYTKIAEELGASVARVGAAWERMREETSGIKLHADDVGHPTRAGTYLAACVFYRTLFDEPAEGLPHALTTAKGHGLTLDAAHARLLQRVADIEAIPAAAPAFTGPSTAPVKRVAFIADATGTMLGLKFKVQQQELRRAVEQLDASQSFTVIMFRGGNRPEEWAVSFSQTLLSASDPNKAKAIAFLERVKVVGKGTDPRYAIRLAFLQRPDEVHFFSDGEFDNVIGYEQVAEEFRKLNRRRIPVHTVMSMSADAKARETMKRIAEQSNGSFREITYAEPPAR